MARPRVFVSSTFYDLHHVRNGLEKFLQEMGYEPVLHERGQVAYGSTKQMEDYCYREIEKVNIVVSIIGGRFGSSSRENSTYSISNMELKTAIDQYKQVYVFVEQSILSEYRTYLRNKTLEISYNYVDDVRIFQFIEEISALPLNNQIAPFDSVSSITSYLREQWAGMFERFLQAEAMDQFNQMATTLKSTTETLKGLVDLLRQEKNSTQSMFDTREQAIDAIIIQNHPVFARLQTILNVPYRIFFTSITEMDSWMLARKITRVKPTPLFNALEYTWSRKNKDSRISISERLFDSNGALKPLLPGEWQENDVEINDVRDINLDDEIPF